MTPSNRFISETTFHVRYAETDKMGVVHHAVYLDWFEEGRSAYIREQGWSYADIERDGFFLVAAELEAKYHRAARYDRSVTVSTWVLRKKSRAVTFACHIRDTLSDETLFSATLKLICLNKRGEVTRIPSSWATWLRV